MRTVALVVFSLACSSAAHASTPTISAATKTLEAALSLAGPEVARLPVALTGIAPVQASDGVEAWTLFTDDGHGERIVVYSESDVFRCASRPDRLDYQCLLKLASALVHEAWHYRHGGDEADAYAAQIAFLTTRGGSATTLPASVLRGRTSLRPDKP